MTKLEYLENTYLFESNSQIIESGENEFGKYIILDKTIFYPQGGGQPSDIGEIIFGKEEIFKVEKAMLDKNGIVFHYGNYNMSTKGFNPLKKVSLKINPKNRIKNAKNHTAGHLIDIAVKNIGLELVTKKGFHFESGPYIEYSGTYNIEEKENTLKKLNLEINNLISQNLEIFVQNNLNGNSPEGKSFRKVYFKNYERLGCGCGGTHLSSSGEIGKIEIKNIKNKKGNCKISYELI